MDIDSKLNQMVEISINLQRIKKYKTQSSINSLNSGKLLTFKDEDNPEPRLKKTVRSNDYPEMEYTQVSGSGEHLENLNDDIVCSIWKHIAVHKRTHIN